MSAIDKEQSLLFQEILTRNRVCGGTRSWPYLDTHNAPSPTAVLALGHSLIAVAQGIKSQDPSNTVPYQADLRQETEAGEEG